MKTVNKLLAIFGLMRIKRAQSITSYLHCFYVDCVTDSIKRDYGDKAKPESIPEARTWWAEAFGACLETNTDKVVIPMDRVFKDYKTIKQS